MTKQTSDQTSDADYLPDDDPMGARRRFADILSLHKVCAEAKCRRARACAAEGTPCIRRCRSVFEPFLPELRAALRRRLAKVAGKFVADEKAAADEVRRWRSRGRPGR